MLYDNRIDTFDSEERYHSYNDLPAVITSDGSKYWFKHGNLHRDGDKPAVITRTGSKRWYKDGDLHRIGNPAATWTDTDPTDHIEYWINGDPLIGDDIPKTEEDWIILVLRLAQSYYE